MSKSDKVYPTITLENFKSSAKQPYSVAFVYCQEGPVVIKGMMQTVETFIHDKYDICHYKITHWKDNDKTELWRVNRPNWKIINKLVNNKKLYNFLYNNEVILTVKRIPQKYLNILKLTENEN